MNVTEVNPLQLADALKTCREVDQPAMIHGSPGIGKSDIVHQLAASAAIPLKDIRLLLHDPVELRGLPHIVEGQTCQAPPKEFPTDGEGVIFWDEITSAPRLNQASAYQAILDKRLGELKFGEGWYHVGAGNLMTDRAVVNRMPSALSNRFVHFLLKPDMASWEPWALNNGIHSEIIAFLRLKPELLHDFKPDADESAFPSPRSWSFINKVHKKTTERTRVPLYQGAIGQGAAFEFISFLDVINKLPAPKDVLANPTLFPMPEDASCMYALAGAMADIVDEKTMGNFKKFVERMPPEFQILAIRDCTARNIKLSQTREYISWSSHLNKILMP